MRNDEDDSLQRELAESSWLLDLARTLVGAGRAEDLVQEAWLERLRRPEEARQPRAFMATILRRLAGRSFREEARRRAREEEARSRREHVVSEAADRGKRLALLWREVEELGDDDRSIVVFRYLDGLEPQHIARKLDISPNAARVRLHRALDRLRHNLDRRHGGRREDWLRALAPLVLVALPAPTAAASASASSGLTKVTLLMTAQKKLILAATLIMMVGGAAYFLKDFGAAEKRALEDPSGSSAPALERAERAERAELPRRSAPTDGDATAESRPAFDQDKLVAGVLEAAIGSTLRNLIAGPRLVGGRVVDEQRRPVAGAKILWRPTSGGLVSTSSDAEGRFQVLGGGTPIPGTTREGMLSAGDTENRWAFRRIVLDDHVRADRIDVVLVLEKTAALQLGCIDQEGKILGGARIEIRDADGGLALVGESDSLGGLRARLPRGKYRVIGADEAAVAETSVVIGGDDEVEALLRFEAQPAIEVLVNDEQGRPIEGAEVLLFLDGAEFGPDRVLRADFPDTDEAGLTRIQAFGPLHRADIGARADGYRAADPRNLAEVTRDGRAEIRLETKTELVWELRDGEVARPADGETVRLFPETQALEESGVEDIPLPADAFGAVPGLGAPVGARARVEDGKLVVGVEIEGATFIAVTERGEIARLWTGRGPAHRGELSFRRPRRVDVRVTDGERPLAELGVQLRTQGGDPLRPTATTSSDGRVSFEGFPSGVLDVFVGPPGQMRDRAHRVVTVDLDEASRTIDVVLQPELDCLIEVRLDGRPGLPGRYELDLEDARIVETLENATAGTIHLRYRPLRARWQRGLRIRAEGWLPANTQIPLTPEARLRLDLEPAAALTGVVRLPADRRVDLEILRFDVDRGDWVAAVDEVLADPRSDPMSLAFADLQPGRYRLVDRLSRLWSDEALLSSDGSAALELDLSRVEDVAGRVVIPAGCDLSKVRVGTSGDEVDGRDGWRLFGIPADQDGRFELRIDRGRRVVIEGRHPRLLPAAVASTALPTDKGEIVLRLEPGPSITAVLPRDIEPASRLRVFGAGERDRPLVFVPLLRSDGRLELANLRPGRYDFVFDCAPYAPLIVEGIEVGDQDLDLGILAFDPGLEIVVEIELPAGAEIPDLYLSAERLDALGAVRFKNATGENPVRLGGLAPGRHRIEIGAVPSRGDERRFVIDVEPGKTPVLSYP